MTVFLLASSILALRDDAAVVAEARAAFAANRAAMRSLECEVATSGEPKTAERVLNEHFWIQGANIRLDLTSAARRETCIQGERALFALHTNPNLGEFSGVIAMPGDGFTLWSKGLFSFATSVDSGRNWEFVDEILGRYPIRQARRMREGGKELIYLAATSPKCELELWLDPALSCIVQKGKLTETSGGKLSADYEMVEPQTLPGQIVFPKRTRNRTFGPDGRLLMTGEFEFNVIAVNTDIPAETFVMRFPPNILVGDSFRGAMFRTDANGQPTIPARNPDGSLMQIVQRRPAEAPAPTAQLQLPTLEEARPWTNWLLPAGLALVAGGLCLAFWSWRAGRGR